MQGSRIAHRGIGAGIALALLLAACSSAEVYNATAGVREQSCAGQPPREQEQCLRNARVSYGEYKQARDETVQQSDKQ